MNQDYSLKEDIKYMDYEDLQQAAKNIKKYDFMVYGKWWTGMENIRNTIKGN